MAEAKPPHLSAEAMRDLVEYDGVSGCFRWKPGRRCRKRWFRGCKTSTGYLLIVLGKRYYLAHRLAWYLSTGEWPPHLDHANGDKTDNRIENLRPATKQQNAFNQKLRSTNRSGFKGVYFDRRRNKWRAEISGKFLGGNFLTREDAHTAYVAAAAKLQGEFMRKEP